MNPSTYDDREDESDAPDPADWPLGKPGRPLGRLSGAARFGARPGAGRMPAGAGVKGHQK